MNRENTINFMLGKGTNSLADLAFSGTHIFVDADRVDDEGDGKTPNSAYQKISTALAACTATRKTILVMPGEYVQTASLLWPNISGISLLGLCGNADAVSIVGVSGADEIIEIDPSVQTATFSATIGNLTLSCPDGVDGITFDNNNVGRKINLALPNIAIECDTATDKAINVVHTSAAQAMRIYCDGLRGILEGLVYINVNNVDDRFFFTNMQFDGGIQFGTETKAGSSMFKDCIMKDAGGSGGQDTQILTVLNCHSLTAETTYAIAALGDFAANAAEVILPAA